METIIFDCKKIAENCKEELKNVKTKPTIAIVTVGDDEASKVYVRNKMKACHDVNFPVQHYLFEEETSTEKVRHFVETLNKDTNITSIIVQLPLPKHIDEEVVLEAIDWWKDPDAFHKKLVAKLATGKETIMPCTTFGIIRLFKEYNIDLEGKIVAVLGRSRIVGRPTTLAMINAGAMVASLNSKTPESVQKTILGSADIIISAIGKPKYIKKEMVKEGAIIVDVGINRDENGKLCGDVDFENMIGHAGAITPVPGGVGLLTVTSLLLNSCIGAKIKKDFNL